MSSRFFGHNDGQPQGEPPDGRLVVAGLAEYAGTQGWRPAGASPLDSIAQEFVHDASRTMFGAARSVALRTFRVGPTFYRDCYQGTVSGREFWVGNAWTSVVDLHAVSVCHLRLGWYLSEPVWIEPARFVSVVAARRLPAGDPAFDRQFRVHGAHAQTISELLVPTVRALMMARDDWFFTIGGNSLLCLCRAGYRAPEDVRQRLGEVTGIAGAFPPPSAQRAAAEPITLSNGAVYDPADIEQWKAALLAVPAAQRQQMLDELRARLAERRNRRSR